MDHPVQLTEDTSVVRELNFIFWFRIHLLSRGIELDDLSNQLTAIGE